MTTPLPQNTPHPRGWPEEPKKPLATVRLLAAILCPVILVIALQRITIEQPLKNGDPAPNLELRDLNGEAISLTNLYKQRLAVLFFSVDCPHCRKELRHVDGLQNAFNGQTNFLLITTSERARTKSLLDSLGINSSVAVDDDGRARLAFGAFTVPALFLINQQGIIHTSTLGERTPGIRREQLESFLRATAEPRPSAGPPR